MANSISFMKDALKSIPGLADVGVPHGDGDGPRTPSPRSQMSGGVRKKFQISNLTIPKNISFIKYALKSVPGLADVGSPMGMGMVPELHPDVWKVLDKFSND